MQCFLIMRESCFYNCFVLIFELVDLYILVSELTLTCIFFNLKNTNGTCSLCLERHEIAWARASTCLNQFMHMKISTFK